MWDAILPRTLVVARLQRFLSVQVLPLPEPLQAFPVTLVINRIVPVMDMARNISIALPQQLPVIIKLM